MSECIYVVEMRDALKGNLVEYHNYSTSRSAISAIRSFAYSLRPPCVATVDWIDLCMVDSQGQIFDDNARAKELLEQGETVKVQTWFAYEGCTDAARHRMYFLVVRKVLD